MTASATRDLTVSQAWTLSAINLGNWIDEHVSGENKSEIPST